MLAQLADCEHRRIKESSGATSRNIDLQNAVGDRFVVFCGLDD